MLYNVYEAERSFIEPFADMAGAAAKLYGDPSSPFGRMPGAARLSASFALFNRLGKDYDKPDFDMHKATVGGKEIAIDVRAEMQKPFCQLTRFKRFTDDPATLDQLKHQPAVLLVAPLSGHHATLLRDTVRTLLQSNRVYITEWTDARMVPLADGIFHLDDYVHYIEEFIRHIQGKYGNCHVISVCQPTVPVLAAISLMASRGEKTPLTMTMMGGPIDARLSPTVVDDLATTHSMDWFTNNLIYTVPSKFPGAGRKVYPGFLQHAGFVAMNPGRHVSSHWDYFRNLVRGDDANAEAHRKFYDEYNAVLDMDAAYYLETIRTVFQDFSLTKGTWDVKAADGSVERVRPQDIHDTALLTVEGELDDISGVGQTHAALNLCAGIPAQDKARFDVEGAGHYGIFSGHRWRQIAYPRIQSFIDEHAEIERAAAAAHETARSVRRA